jgi:hypothetical protein
MTEITFHYLVMAQKDLLENQCLEEILRERATYFSIRKKQRDFWMVVSPSFLKDPTFKILKSTQFYKQKKAILSTTLGKTAENSEDTNFFVSLISLDKEFINWVELRLGYFENIENDGSIKTEGSEKKNFVSDGIKGSFVVKNSRNPLLGYSNYLHPDILLKRNTKFLELYYKTFNKKELKV